MHVQPSVAVASSYTPYRTLPTRPALLHSALLSARHVRQVGDIYRSTERAQTGKSHCKCALLSIL